MNPESPTPREQLEARLTALLLGELPPDEAAALREIISKDAQLAALHDRLKQTIELVRETAVDPAELAAEPPAPRRLGEERRQKLLAQFKTVTPKEFARPRPQQSPWIILFEAAAVIAVIGCLAGLLLPSLARSKAKAQIASDASRAKMRELEEQMAADNATTQPLSASETPLAPAPTGPDVPAIRTPKQETIVLPSTVDTDQLAGGGNARDVKLVDNYNLNPVALSDAAKKEPLLENKDAYVVQDLALLSSEAQDKLSTANDVRLGERIEKEKTDGAEAPVALQIDKDAVSFNESNTRGLPGAVEGKNVNTGVENHGAVQAGTKLAGLYQPGINGQPTAAASPPVATSGGSVVMFQNGPSGSVGGASDGGRGGGIGGGGGGFGGGGAGQSGTQNAWSKPMNQAATTGNWGLADGSVKPGSTGTFHNYISAPATGEVKQGQEGVAHSITIANAEPQDVLNNPEVTTVSGQSSTVVDQLVLTHRAQTVQQNRAAQPSNLAVFGNNFGGTTATITNVIETVTPSYDAETHSVIMLSDDRTAGSVSNLVAQLDTSAGKTLPSMKLAVDANAIASEDRPLPKLAPPPPSEPQPEVQVSENAFSTFSLNVSDVSFKLAAASLERGVMPDAGSVRSEEFINAFDYRDPAPAPGAPIGFAWERAHYPFAHNRDLLRFSVKTAAAGRQPGRPLNIVLLLDNSGSMERADRVAIIHEALRVLAAQLQSQDTISVVTFARTARLWVDGIPGPQAGQVLETVGSLTPEGGTDLGDALDLAYATAKRHYLLNGVNRVVLLTDGAANLGNVNPNALKKNVEAQRKQGIDLDCFGIGWEGYNDDLLEVLTRNGDGRYGFINTPEEAATGFAAQLAGALRVAASDVKVQVEFNPARVISYRQIGYAKHQLTKEQFHDNTVAAAQIGAAESGNALYTVEVNPQGTGPVCTVHVRYRDPGTANYYEHAWDVPYTGNAVALEQASPAMRLAATASAFSEWLVSNPFAADVTPDALLGYLRGVPAVYGADTRPAQLETMIREAKSVTGK
jgi:Mg-chelatase subunit ChlD/type II secretory pathway pseudopilin PulG